MTWKRQGRTLLLSFCMVVLLIHGGCLWQPVMGGAVVKASVEKLLHQCVVVVNNVTVHKPLGAEWVLSDDACAVHTCHADSEGRSFVTISQQDCSQIYCDVDSELRTDTNSCCGTCVRSKCRHNYEVYELGEIWHNPNDCTLLQCAQLSDGQPMINIFQRECALLPADCAPQRIYIADCCPQCNTTTPPQARQASKTKAEAEASGEDIWTEDYYRNHSCARECRGDATPQTCHYKFVVEWYQTLSKACYNCPLNISDCTRPHCIPTDGVSRSVTVVNRMMPGPAIEVCERDLIVVDVENELLGESTTIHWHGLHQRETPYMDGVPHISQCPISPHATFRYSFRANRAGTHFWHSHTGMQRGDGVFGAFIVRRSRQLEPHGHLYDFDLSEHKMIVQDWVHMPGVSMFADHHHSRGDNKPRTLLINGRGRFYHGIWDDIKTQREPVMVTTEKMTDATSVVDASIVGLLQPQGAGGRLETTEINGPVRLAPHNEVIASTTIEVEPSTTYLQNVSDNVTAPHPRVKRSVETSTPLIEMPLQVYKVKRGYRYRFRIINAEFLNCPIALSIDNHSLTAIASDGYDFEAIEVGSIVTYAGERFDFVLHANQSIGNYWVRLKGLMDCSEQFTSAFQVAILRYDGAAEVEPTAPLGYAHTAEGVELNVMNRGSGHLDTLTVAELTGLPVYDVVPGVDRTVLKPEPDYKFFVYYDFYVKDNPVFHPMDLYGIDANLTAANRLFTPQLNHISLQFPAGALLPARDQFNDTLFCNETSLVAAGVDCRKQFCKCHHVLQVALGAIVELIIVDEGFTFDANHPFHLHGNAFRVLALERLGRNVTIEMIKQLDSLNMLKRNLVRPPIKDTVTVPDGGYTIVRFQAYNPGFWLLHCHIEFHSEIGMALVLKVGSNEEMPPVPSNFPSCHDYLPTRDESEQDEHEVRPPSTLKPLRPGDDGVAQAVLNLTVFLAFLLTVCIVR